MSAIETVDYDDTISRLRDLRLRMNLSQAALAERFGLSMTTLKQWETGRRVPDTAVLTYLEIILIEPEVVAQLVSRASWRQRRRLTAA